MILYNIWLEYTDAQLYVGQHFVTIVTITLIKNDEQFGSLGVLQIQGNNATVSLIDPEIHGGFISEVIYGLKRNGGLIRDTSADTRYLKQVDAGLHELRKIRYW